MFLIFIHLFLDLTVGLSLIIKGFSVVLIITTFNVLISAHSLFSVKFK